MNFDDFRANCPSRSVDTGSGICKLVRPPNMDEVISGLGSTNKCCDEFCPTWYSMLFTLGLSCNNTQSEIKVLLRKS